MSTLYARTARNYWETYLPSQVAELTDPTVFFDDLGMQVQEQVEQTMSELMRPQAGRPLTPLERVGEALAAKRQAEELAMSDLVYLPKEPGTERREVPSVRPLPGWDGPLPGVMPDGTAVSP